MDSFFLVEPIDISGVKAKKTFNENPKKIHNYQIVP